MNKINSKVGNKLLSTKEKNITFLVYKIEYKYINKNKGYFLIKTFGLIKKKSYAG